MNGIFELCFLHILSGVFIKDTAASLSFDFRDARTFLPPSYFKYATKIDFLRPYKTSIRTRRQLLLVLFAFHGMCLNAYITSLDLVID